MNEKQILREKDCDQPHKDIRVIPCPDRITIEQITELLHRAHETTASKGMHFTAFKQTPEDTKRRLGENGLFYVALTPEDRLVGAGAIVFHEKGSKWYFNHEPYAEIKMVGVDPDFRGRGISNRIYDALETHGFNTVNMLTMNTAAGNAPVLGRNARHGWKYIDYCSWRSTDYYSVIMGKWKNCPYASGRIRFYYLIRKIIVTVMRDQKGSYRLLPQRRTSENH